VNKATATPKGLDWLRHSIDTSVLLVDMYWLRPSFALLISFQAQVLLRFLPCVGSLFSSWLIPLILAPLDFEYLSRLLLFQNGSFTGEVAYVPRHRGHD